MHLTEEELNEYLDNEIQDRARVELHLSLCKECTTRLAALQVLFNEIESLPEVTLSQDFREATLWDNASSLPAPLPRSLRLTVTVQAAIALIAIIIAAPLVMDFVSPYLITMQTPSFADVFVQLQSQWSVWLDILSQINMPILPEIPVIELSSLVITFTLVVVSMLWLVGNGLLLRNQNK